MSFSKSSTALNSAPIGKLLYQYALPAIIAMTASSLYNMVDSIFIGHGVGPMAISGLAITFPLMNLAAAFGAMVGVGGATFLSVQLGKKDYISAQHILGNVVSLNVVIGILFGITCLLFLDPILYFFGAGENTISYAREYMQIILWGNVITHLYLGLNGLLRASGNPQKAMYATILTVVINTILDPIFIYTFKWGIRGAAIATILSQIISLIWQIKLFTNQNEIIHFKKGIYHLKKYIVDRIIGIGMAPFLLNLAACFVVIFINKGLKQYGGDLSIGAFGIVNRISFVFVMIVMGLNQGMQPIVGYNFGAHNYHRVNEVLKLTIYVATIITSIGFLIGMIIPRQAVALFTSHQELIELSATGLRIVVMFFPIIGFQIVTANFFQSIGIASKAIFLSLTRQVLFLIPCIFILPKFMGSKGIWYSMPISDLLASIIAGILLYRQFKLFKQKINPMDVDVKTTQTNTI